MAKPHKGTRWLIIVLIVLTLFSIFLNLFHPTNNFDKSLQEAIGHYLSGMKQPEGKDATVDYDHIKEYVNLQVAQTKPKDGTNATQEQIATALAQYMISNPPKDGQDGVSIKGDKGDSCTTVQNENGAIIACEDGTSAVIRNGTDAYIELRCNENKNRWEVKYNPEDSFSVLNGKATQCKAGL